MEERKGSGQECPLFVRPSPFHQGVATMTHKGDHLGMPATGKPVKMTGMTMVRISNGQVVRAWDNWDQSGMMRQLGI